MSHAIESPFGNTRAELAQTAGARQGQSREVAEMQVTYLMAQQFPRDPKAAMDRILDAFTRLSLAEKSQYEYSRGGTEIRGPSIKAMEAIAAEWENIDVKWRILSRGVDARGIPFSEVEASATDTQTRTRKSIAFIVSHWRDTKTGGYALKDERDVYELCANMAQRRVRACIEAVIPTDVIEAAMAQADTTLQKVDTSPEAMQKMLAAFEPFGVTKAHIEKRIQRALDTIKPTQVVTLKRIYASLRDSMSEPTDWFDMPASPGAQASGTAAHFGEAVSKTETIKARMRERGGEPAAPKAEAPEPEPAPPQSSAPPVDTAPSYAEIATAFQEAQTVEDVDAIADLIRTFEPAEQRDELSLIYRQRRDELDPPFESNPPTEPARSRARGRRTS
ncbi:hypothetical protein ISF62_18395 [Burkholderia pseudomallei]|nr:hypothetical protein [Burkholderia pseudomallei]CAJ3245490.1 Uncharacterised protein [Burkholderia pseudomallei]CAJ8244152.1 Uncharacterised protein [Burkholderia pseudomallei]VBF29566.1 Uncharacterised protein [Burkholderia pseudomallei]